MVIGPRLLNYFTIIMRFFHRLPWVVMAAVLPIVAAFLLKVPRVALDCFTDSVFYLAYARHFGELVLRYGFPYYATRFGGILPDALCGTLFGQIDGIWILRYGLAATVSVVLFLFFRKRYGVLTGLLASLFWSFNPAVLRLLCTTYVDSMAVPFLILGCCLFASGWGGRFGALVAGILAALAASAHLYAAFALFLLSPWFLAAFWGNRPLLLRSLCWMAGGFLGTFLLGWLWYWIVWGMPAFFSPTVEVLRDLGNGGAAQWKKPLALVLRETPAWFAPLALLVPVAWSALLPTSISHLPSPISALIRGVALSLLASIGFFWGGDLFGKAYVLSMPFYYSFLLPVTILGAATLCGELIASQQKKLPRLFLFSGLLIAGVTPALLANLNWLSPVTEAIFLTALVLPLLFILEKPLLTTLGLLGIASAALLVASTGMFSWIVGHYPSKDIPVLELTFALQKELPKAAEDGRVMRFWYDDDPGHPGGTDCRMIGSFWLHTFGKLTAEKDSYVSFPEMNASDAALISGSGMDRLVVFDQDPNQVAKALEVISARGLPFRVSKRVTLSAPSDPSRKLEVAILERMRPGTDASATPLDLRKIQAVNHGKMTLQGDAVELTSGTVRWWAFAKLPLGGLKKGESLRIRFKIEKGMIRFTLNDEKKESVEHVGKWRMADEQELILTAPRDLPDASLSLDSMYPYGTRSQVLIEKIEKITTPVP